MSVVERIRRNDPRGTWVSIHLVHENQLLDGPIAEALEQNPYITDICLFAFDRAQSWPRLHRHIETRNNLRDVFVNAVGPARASVERLLQAIQRNMNVRDFGIFGFGVAIGTLVAFLNAATHLTRVNLQCTIQNNNATNDGPALLAAALQGAPNLQSLRLARNFQSAYLIAIFDCLKRKQSLQTLAVDSILGFSDAALASFKELMRSTWNIQKLEICCSPGTREKVLEVVKSNFSLRTIINTSDPNDETDRMLQFYTDRNKRMAQFLERPTSVPKHLRPWVLHVASQAEPSVLYRCLLAICGDLGATKRTRKRKRPAYYKP